MTGLTFCLCCCARGLFHIRWNPFEVFRRHVQTERIGRIQCVFAELLGEFCLSFLQPCEPLLGLSLQLGAAQNESTHGVAVGLCLLRVQPGDVHGLVLGIQTLVGTQPGPEFGHARQRFVVGSPQLGCVGHAVEVSDCTPGARQSLGGHVEPGRQGAPVRRKLRRRDVLQGGIGFLQQGIDGGRHVGRGDGIEPRQCGEIEQWVVSDGVHATQ